MNKRRLFLAAYDVADEARLRRVHRLIKAYATGGQKSVFECWLNTSERQTLLRQAETLLQPPEDRFFLLRLDPRQKATLLGMAAAPSDPLFFYQG